MLGDPKAPVELVEFGDLQCPVCKAASEEALPPIFDGAVAKGEAKISFRNFIIISEESEPAGAAAIAAGEQGRGWNFIELFYRNQGVERSGYVTDEFLTAIAEGAGVSEHRQMEQRPQQRQDQKRSQRQPRGSDPPRPRRHAYLHGQRAQHERGRTARHRHLVGELESAIEAAG